MRGLKYSRFLAFLSLLLSAAAPLLAQTVPSNETKVYERSFFNPFNPQTARDIVNRIPGFTFDRGDDLRGFGGAAGNVLIDGVRPSSKSGGIEDALNRIPANDVARVEVIRGAAGASESAGQSVVANLIRSGARRSASWKLELERNSEGVVYPRAEGSLTARIGEWSTSTKLNGFWEQFDLIGRRDRLDANGTLITAQTEDRPSAFTQGFVSTEAIRALAGGKLTINLRGGYSGFFPVTDRFQFDGREPDEAPDGRVYIDFDSVQWTGEGGVDWARTFSNDWTFKTIALAAIKPLDELTIIRNERPVNSVIGGSRFTNRQTPIETVLRTTLARGGDRRLRPEFGVEAAYNRLDSAFSLSIIDAAGNASAIALPASNVVVQEFRGEAFANVIWKAASSWTIETGLGAEASSISVRGDAESDQSFFFLKPFANVLYRPHAAWQFRLGARRSVGQLDFGDFAASAEGDLDRQFGGNPELGPDQTWRAAFAVDWRNEARGAINVEFFHEWRSDVLEQLVLPSGAFGVANAGNGRVWGVTASSSLKLAPLLPGGLFEARATLRDSSFDDPLTGLTRTLTNIASPQVRLDFRHDVPVRQLSWGASYTLVERNDFFFANEVSDFSQGGSLSAFFETTRWLGIKSRLSLREIGGRRFIAQRDFFDPDRGGAVAGAEIADRTRGMFVTLTVEGQS